MAAIFQLKSNDNNEYYFHLVDAEGRLLLMSGEFGDKEELKKTIEAVRVGSLMGHQIAAGKVPEGDSFFVIKDDTGQVIAKSLLFSSDMLFDNALHNVKDNACIAEVADLTA